MPVAVVPAPDDREVRRAAEVLAAAGRARAALAWAPAPAPAPAAPAPAAKRTPSKISSPTSLTPEAEQIKPRSQKRHNVDPIAAAQEPVVGLADTVAPARAMEF